MEEPITFRAGKCDYDEQTGICTPKPMRGKITIKASEEAQGFYDFEWSTKERISGVAVEPIEFILIPGETKWIEIKSAKNGRVLCLLFSTGEKWFFWLQEKHAGYESLNEWSDKDKELFAKLQKLLEFDDDQDEDENMDKEVNETDHLTTTDAQTSNPNAQDTLPAIQNLSAFLNKEQLQKHIETLDVSSSEFKELCSFLPDGMEKTKQNLLKCVLGPFFEQAVNLLDSVTKQDYSGQQLSQTLGYSYTGEGPSALIQGLRSKGTKEKSEKEESDDENDDR